MHARIGLFILLVLFLVGCQTYQPYSSMNQFGYLDSRSGQNQFQVAFVGKQNSSLLEAREAALLRSAELTVQNGFDYFVITDEQRGSIDRAVTTHQPNQFVGVISTTSVISRPSVLLSIEAFSGTPPAGQTGIFVARDVIRYSTVRR